MHPSALNNGKLFFDTYSPPLLESEGSIRVVEIGSQDVNGSIRQFCPQEFEYIGVDFVDGKGVDVVIISPYELPFDDNSVDIVVSSSCFEHSEMFWVVYLEIIRILKPHGVFYLNVPSNGMFHRYPVDCWRFYPDSGPALVTWAQYNNFNVGLMESYTSNQVGNNWWNDFVAVYIKNKEYIKQYPKRILYTDIKYTNGILDNLPVGEFLNFQDYSEDHRCRMMQLDQLEQETQNLLQLKIHQAALEKENQNFLQLKAQFERENLNKDHIIAGKDHQLHAQSQNILQLKAQFEREISNKDHVIAGKDHQLHAQSQQYHKYKKLWTTRLLKPLIKTEQALSSANTLRKGFRNLVKDKGSVGKAYQHLRRMRKTDSLKAVKNFLRTSLEKKPQAQPLKVVDNKINILVTPHTQFVAHLLESTLCKYGFVIDVSVGECHTYSDDVHIVICPQMFKVLPNRYIAFQMEQSVSSRWFTDEYIRTLQDSYAILDYSLQNIGFLQDKDVSYKQLFWMPIGAYPNYKDYLLSSKRWDGSLSEQAEVVFYGDPNNDRRMMYLNALKEKFKVKIISEKFGNELYRELLSAKVVVNIHYYENALLETTRIFECLSLGLQVVSEESSDMIQYTGLDKYVSFVKMGDVDQMIDKVAELLEKTQSSSRPVEPNDKATTFYLSRMLLSLDMIGFEQFHQVCGFDSITPNAMNMYCLGLPENIQRRQSFMNDNQYQIDVFDGLRHSVGWVGCGLSYKYLMTYAKERGLDYIIVCEDDVEFPANFTEKLAEIMDYLKQTPHNWDVFSGLIADLHYTTQILRIDAYKNNEYIYIDKMTSMVFNIYNKSFFEKISCWDNLDTDVETNTIDRYIEMHGGLRVVTTSPFLVGHKEDQTSSLWGFNNSNYSDMFSKTQSLFGAKIDQYKRSHFETNV